MSEYIKKISKKIKINDRKNISYIHPTASNEFIAKLIVAYSNTSGGDIIFGVKDDGIILEISKFPFNIDIKKIKAKIEGKIIIKSGYFKIKSNNLFYISISKSKELVKIDKTTYKINNQGKIEEVEIPKVFISYAHKDSDLADYLEEKLNLHHDLRISRDTNITQYKDSLSEFMQTIRTHDIIISIVTDAYLKSVNCMYEIAQIMKDDDYKERLNFIVIREEDAIFYSENTKYENYQANIYSLDGSLYYLKYWDKQQKEMEESIQSADLRPSLMSNIALEMEKLEMALPSINHFLYLLNDEVGKGFLEMYENDFKDIVLRNKS